MEPPKSTARKKLARLGNLCTVGAVGLILACNGTTDPDPFDDPIPGSYDHGRAPGASARDLLSADDYTRMVVQVQYLEGYEPSSGGLDLLEDFLRERVHKPDGISIEMDEPLAIAPQATYSASQIRAIEETHRTAYTSGDTLAVYLLFVPGEYSESANVLGIAYNNTSTAIFGEVIAEHTGGALQPSESTVTGAVAMHEFGHIFGLVNNGSPMQAEHQDEPNGRHCDDPDCLMYYAVRTTDYLSNLLGDIPELDQDCLDDLSANGGR